MIGTLIAGIDPFWVIVAIWVVAALLGGGKKKQKPRPGAGAAPAPRRAESQPSGLFGELGRALQELKRAEDEARQRAPGQPSATPTPAPDQAARAYLEQRRKQAPPPRRAPPKREVFYPKPKAPAPRGSRAVELTMEDERDLSSEEGAELAVLDYDEEAREVVEERLRAAERRGRGREGESLEVLTPEQIARRQAVLGGAAIGGRAEHAAFHERLAATARPTVAATAAASSRLARFATGRVRDAVVLSEVLGKPMGERM
jgi:hypothetical protein